MNEELTGKCLRQVEHIRGHLCHRYSITVNQVMVATVKPFHSSDQLFFLHCNNKRKPIHHNNVNDHFCSNLSINLQQASVRYETLDKRDDSNCSIANFPCVATFHHHLDISLRWYDILDLVTILAATLLNQWFPMAKVKSSLE